MRHSFLQSGLFAVWALACAVPHLSAQAGSSGIVISQVYGGGGNSGATLRNDFIELFNRGDKPVTITGWSVQYASATGTSWDRTLLSGVIQPGQYFLIQEAQGNAGSVSLPAADASGGINLSAIEAKIALTNNSTLLTGAVPSGSQIVDFIGYGNANAAEGSKVPALTNTTAAIRQSDGCTDTNNNGADFRLGSPAPRNSRSPVHLCAPSISPPQFSASGVTNSASYAGGAVAPGEVITIFGSDLGPTSLTTLQLTADRLYVTKSLRGTRVLFDGVPAAMIYTQAAQVSAIVPYSVAGKSSTEIQVEYNGRTSTRVAVPVVQSAPAIYTVGSTGVGQGAVLHQDYSVNGPSKPAARGAVVSIYGTGGGQTSPDGEDARVVAGSASIRLPVSVRIGGIEAEVSYSGAAPGLVSGVLQVNAKIPDGVAAGPVPVVITVGGVPSQSGVTISVAGQ